MDVEFGPQNTGHGRHRHGGFIQVLRAGGKVQELHRLVPGSVTPVIENGEPAYAVRYLDNRTVTLSWRDVIHVRTPGSTFDRPIPLIEMAAEAIGIDLAMSESQGKLFGNAGRPSGVIESPKRLSRMRGNVSRRHGRPDLSPGTPARRRFSKRA
jgi:phage portal protein BeeE